MKILYCYSFLALCLGFSLMIGACTSDKGIDVTEEILTIKTYPFDDPNPVPFVAATGDLQRKAYPYFSFDGYSHEAVDEEWKVIRLENDYIELTILPEAGGKIWGAVEKSTGKEFIYQNEVKKFRNIALRGPWTSGGIEFNFGSYGHTPVSAAPVDYLIRENRDGSVSAVVGAMDLPSRTEWRVTITLPEDKAYFETESFFYNPTPLIHRNYIWLNAAVKASDDLQLFFPGTYYAGHDGDVHLWPVDEQGRDLSFYRNNAFGSHKSYHVLGKKTEYYGGYWHDEEFGFGNWSHYDDMPGKKLWIWALSRAGGIWEDLLTDDDGQYIEVQSGRYFNQPSDRSIETPFYHDEFIPWASDRWRELWFPVKKIGGIKAATPYAVLNHEQTGRQSVFALMALQSIQDEFSITVGEELVSNNRISLDPLDVYYDTLDLADDKAEIRAVLGEKKLVYNNRKDYAILDRPVENELSVPAATVSEHYRLGLRHLTHRSFAEAMENFYEALEKDSAFSGAYVGLADLHYRRGEYQQALEHARTALSHNAYDPDANHIYGVIKARTGDTVQALEAYGWAARSPKYRSGAYASMAELYLKDRRPVLAAEYANRALEFNRQNINAYKVLAVSYRIQQKLQKAGKVLDTLLEQDPLNHFARFERYLTEPDDDRFGEFASFIRNELPHETYLELALYYIGLGLEEEAVQLLELAPSSPMVHYWLAYLQREHSPEQSREALQRADEESPYLVFPFRLESIPVLEWAEAQNSTWKSSYYLGLIYWNAGRKEEADRQFTRLGDTPDYAPFYLVRGKLGRELNISDEAVYRDFKKAWELDPAEWRTWSTLINFELDEGMMGKALEHAGSAIDKFADNNGIQMDYANALLQNRQYEACVDHLEQIRILPSEHARGSRQAYEQATIFSALEKIKQNQYIQALEYLEKAQTWPENLGVGQPYDPDVRLQKFLEAFVHRQLGNEDRAGELYDDVVDYTETFPGRRGGGYYAAVLSLELTGRNGRARQWMNEWQEAQPGNKLAQWAEAHFNGELQTGNRIMRDNRDQLSFRLVVDAVNTVQGSAGN